MASGAELATGVVHTVAWRIWSSSSRRFFLVLAGVAAGSILLASVAVAFVAARNAAAVADARYRDLRVASSVTQFRNHLSVADAELATALVSGREASPLGRARYETALLEAGRALTDAGLVATGRNADDVADLAESLGRFARLVETSRAYPVGSTFHDLARTEVRDELVPLSDDVRRRAEGEVSSAAERVTGPVTAMALAALALALLVLVASALLVAGRSHIWLHLLLVAAAGTLAADVALMTDRMLSQRADLDAAAEGEIQAFANANAVAFALFDVRSTEAEVVAARGAGQGVYAQLRADADRLVERLQAVPVDTPLDTLLPRVEAYVDGLEEVERLDGSSGNPAAVEATMDGDSAIAFATARALMTSIVNRSTADLEARLDAADTDIAWYVPVALGGAAGAMAGAGVVRRGWAYF